MNKALCHHRNNGARHHAIHPDQSGLIDQGGWHDAVRHYFGDDTVLYSWWSYRARDWAASNRGRRLDHIWTSHDLAADVTSVAIHSDLRGAEKPSDHVPMVIEL